MSNNYTNDDANIKSNEANVQMGNNVCDSPETACPESNGKSNTVTVLAWDCDTPSSMAQSLTFYLPYLYRIILCIRGIRESIQVILTGVISLIHRNRMNVLLRRSIFF